VPRRPRCCLQAPDGVVSAILSLCVSRLRGRPLLPRERLLYSVGAKYGCADLVPDLAGLARLFPKGLTKDLLGGSILGGLSSFPATQEHSRLAAAAVSDDGADPTREEHRHECSTSVGTGSTGCQRAARLHGYHALNSATCA
jgi:hypothetical protein